MKLLNRLIQHHAAYLLQNLPRISYRMVMASDRIALGIELSNMHYMDMYEA